MKDYKVVTTKTLVSKFGTFFVGEYIEFIHKGEKYVGVLSEIDEIHDAIIVSLFNNQLAKSVFELKDIEKMDYVIYD